jgi:hypothetical protein
MKPVVSGGKKRAGLVFHLFKFVAGKKLRERPH